MSPPGFVALLIQFALLPIMSLAISWFGEFSALRTSQSLQRIPGGFLIWPLTVGVQLQQWHARLKLNSLEYFFLASLWLSFLCSSGSGISEASQGSTTPIINFGIQGLSWAPGKPSDLFLIQVSAHVLAFIRVFFFLSVGKFVSVNKRLCLVCSVSK